MTHFTCGALLMSLVAASGCGLIDSDITDFDLTLPEKQFSIDTANWEIDEDQATAVLNTDCSGAPNVCGQAAQAACEMDCSGACSASSSRCEITLAVGLYKEVNLLTDRPELKSINDQPVISVTVDSVKYQVTSNTLTVDTPELQIYIAPMSVMEPGDPEAKLIGTVPPIAAGETVAAADIEFTAAGKAELVKIMSSFKTPFNVIVGSQLLVQSGQAIPTGKLDAVIQIKGHASVD